MHTAQTDNTLQTQQDQYRFSLLDNLRGIAAILVFFNHLYVSIYGHWFLKWNGLWANLSDAPEPSAYIFYPLHSGWVGVQIFFVLSGFVIHWAFLRMDNFDTKKFLWRRFWRVYPPYLLALVFFVLFTQTYLRSKEGLINFISHVFLFYNFSVDTIHSINPAFWSLAVEFQFYLFYPVLLWMLRRWQLKTILFIALIVGLIGTTLASGIYIQAEHTQLQWVVRDLPITHYWEWLCGAYLAERIHKNQPRLTRHPMLITLIAVGAFIGFSFFKPLYFFRAPLVTIISVLLIEKLVSQKGNIDFVSSQSLNLIGRWSYSIYLWHAPLILALIDSFANVGILPFVSQFPYFVRFSVGGALAFICIAAMSGIIYNSVEMPCQKIARLEWNDIKIQFPFLSKLYHENTRHWRYRIYRQRGFADDAEQRVRGSRTG
jgi:peptidoglycan/LPS O-acetylase OafA/YrhL